MNIIPLKIVWFVVPKLLTQYSYPYVKLFWKLLEFSNKLFKLFLKKFYPIILPSEFTRKFNFIILNSVFFFRTYS